MNPAFGDILFKDIARRGRPPDPCPAGRLLQDGPRAAAPPNAASPRFAMLNRPCSLLLVALIGAAPLASAQQTIYVDPALGNDGQTGLTPQVPVKTILQAVALAGPGSTVVLGHGLYDTTNQTFPVLIDKPLTLRGAGACGALIRTDTVFVTNFQVESPDVTFENFKIVSGSSCIKVQPGATEATTVVVRDMTLRGFRGVNVQKPGTVSTLLQADVLVEDCRIECSNGGVICNINSSVAGPAPAVTIRSTTFEGLGEGDGVRIRLLNQAELDLTIEGSILTGQEVGVRLDVVGTETLLELDVRHATFYGLTDAGGTSGAGILGPAGGGTSNIRVDNSIFWQNQGQNDVPDYQPGTYALQACIVEQLGLLGVGGSFLADPQFTRPGAGDFHLAPGSPAINAAVPLGVPTEDMDGDPTALDCAAGLPDIGADEHVSDYLYFTLDPKIGIANRLRVVAPAGDLFVAAYVLNGGVGGVCSYPLPSSFKLAPNGAGVVGADGVGEVNIPFPNDPALVGIEVTWGGVMGNATEIRLMANLHVAPICD